MNQQSPQRLRWWFWVVLFCPTIVFMLIGLLVELFVKGYDQLGWMFATGIFVGMPVNIVCSFISAMSLNRAKGSGTTWRSTCGGTFLLSVMNMILACAGCSAAAGIGSAMNK